MYSDVPAIERKINELIKAVNVLLVVLTVQSAEKGTGLDRGGASMRREMPCFCGTENAYRCPAHVNPVDGYTSGGR